MPYHIPDLTVTPEALAIWNQIPSVHQNLVLSQVWCVHCHQLRPLSLRSLVKENDCLILKGHCKTCGGIAVRVFDLT